MYGSGRKFEKWSQDLGSGRKQREIPLSLFFFFPPFPFPFPLHSFLSTRRACLLE